MWKFLSFGDLEIPIIGDFQLAMIAASEFGIENLWSNHAS